MSATYFILLIFRQFRDTLIYPWKKTKAHIVGQLYKVIHPYNAFQIDFIPDGNIAFFFPKLLNNVRLWALAKLIPIIYYSTILVVYCIDSS